MSDDLAAAIKGVCQANGRDRTRMMDIVRAVQESFGCVSARAIDLIAREVSTHRVEVEGVVSFYAFLSDKPKGQVAIRLCNGVIDRMAGADHIAGVFAQELGIEFGETTPDGRISLDYTPCIGMCDQAPAALVNEVVVTELSSDSARAIVRDLQKHHEPRKLVHRLGDRNNAHALVKAMVLNNVRRKGPVIFSKFQAGQALSRALSMSPMEVIRAVKTARLRGRGGAGFPTGMKWEFTRAAPGEKRYVICNADEGEPGTFKDRVILTERSDLLFEGMTIAGYAVGGDTGIVYLRGEYAYLRSFLEYKLQERRDQGLLGRNICGKEGFHFDIRIQMGAGSYVCGEETALISSCEGLRGEPRNRPPFPAQKGYLGRPTTVNNVETFCCVSRILEKGAPWFAQLGSPDSTGTKLLSISGDCLRPGVYEVPFGIPLSEVLQLVGAEDAIAVQVGGPSGQMVAPRDFLSKGDGRRGRAICFEDLATGGAIMVFGPERNVPEIAAQFTGFFMEESCGYCTPCRVGNVLLKERLDKIVRGQGQPSDLDYLQNLAETIKTTSRCGLGQTSPNPVLTTLKNFRPVYEALVRKGDQDVLGPSFDIHQALSEAKQIAGRESVLF